ASNLTTSFFITIAIAEASLLIGFVFTVVSNGTRPFLVGLGMFAVALAVILLSFGQIEVETDGTPGSLIR
ncbi:MAG: hypothetical protein OEM97_12115, partial [Acidimicrobiia bacterium]|nr:hypothetical protein [Acidimicrobiia bacterium]